MVGGPGGSPGGRIPTLERIRAAKMTPVATIMATDTCCKLDIVSKITEGNQRYGSGELIWSRETTMLPVEEVKSNARGERSVEKLENRLGLRT
jgi:hypothetical protein